MPSHRPHTNKDLDITETTVVTSPAGYEVNEDKNFAEKTNVLRRPLPGYFCKFYIVGWEKNNCYMG